MTGTEPAVLEPERIARMRAGVMGAVEADRRSRRRSRLVVGAAAAATVVVIGGAVGAGLSGGLVSGSDSQSAGTSSADIAAEPDTASRAEVEPPSRSTIITTGSISVRVDDVDRAAAAIRAFATARGGRIDGESVESQDAPFADLTVRVPATHVPALRELVESTGDVRSMNVSREDVATQVADVESRIASLETSIRRLRAIVAEADSTQALLQAETQLTQRQSDLESLQAQERVLRDQTSLATIQVSLHSDEAPRAVEPDGFRGGLTDGWNALVAATNTVVTAAGFVVPWLLPLGALVTVVALARRRRRS